MNEDMIVQPGADNPKEERTKGGLIVPQGTIQKKRRVITNAQWKNWRRTIKSMREQGIGLTLSHDSSIGDEEEPACGQQLMPVENIKALECECTLWVISDR